MPHVLIAGGGVAALEAALALRALAPDPVDVELLGPEPHFWYRPLSVAEPFGRGEARHYELSTLAADAGARFTLGELQGVDVAAHEARTSVGAIAYDVLLVAIGANPVAAVPGAETFRGPADTGAIRGILAEAVAGHVHRIAFVVPWGATWALPAYELALMTATHLRAHDVEGVELVLVTPEEEPLQLFGRAGIDAVQRLLEEHEIRLVTLATASEFSYGALSLSPEGRIPCDRAIALPRLQGPRLDGLPQTLDGFVPVDAHGSVVGARGRLRRRGHHQLPGEAGRDRDAARRRRRPGDRRATRRRPRAAAVPADSPRHAPHGGTPRFLRHELGASAESAMAGSDLLWWPPAKIVGRYLSPFLAGLGAPEEPPAVPSGQGVVEIEVALTDRELERLAAPPQAPEPEETVGESVGDVMSTELLVVAPEDTLGEVAERMRRCDTGCAAVAHYGRLIGILTSRDLLRAFAARVHPSEARVREWMTADPVTVPVSAGLEHAITQMNTHAIHHLPVVDGERPVGMLGYRQAVSRTRASGVGLGF